jgi:hypothetical protein
MPNQQGNVSNYDKPRNTGCHTEREAKHPYRLQSNVQRLQRSFNSELKEAQMNGLEEAVLRLWNEGLTVPTILQKLGLDDEEKDKVEDIIEAPGNYGVVGFVDL